MRSWVFVVGPFAISVSALACGGDDDAAAAPDPSSDAGGTSTLGAGVCGTAASDPTAAATIGGYLDTLGSAGPNADLKPQIVDAVLRACDAFGPSPSKNSGWKRSYCWAHLASEILKESSYRPDSVVTDSYATRTVAGQKANDPTVGLLQIRFSSVVRNFAVQGSRDRLSCVGCTLPPELDSHQSEAGDSAYWAVSGPTANQKTLQNVACNVGLGAWYVYLNATGNGKSSAATYLDAYCKGDGTAGNLITGFRSFVNGPTGGKGIIADEPALQALKSSDGNVYKYITAVRASFDGMVTPPPSPHPFFVALAPNPTQFCR